MKARIAPLVLVVCVAGCVPDVPTSASCGSVSGQQNAGTSAPTIAGPASGTVSVGATLAVTGVSITDAPAVSNTGAMVVEISVSAGTVSATAQGGLIAGSGTSTIMYSASLSAINAALAGLTYDAPDAPTTDVLKIIPTDQYGKVNTLSIPITVTAASACNGDGGP